MTQPVQARFERIQPPRLPRLKQTGQRHSGFGAFGAARATANLADHHQRPGAALRQIVVGTQPRYQHELEQFIFMPQQPPRQRLTRVRFHLRIAQPKRMRSVHQHHILLLALCRAWLWVLVQPLLRVIIQRPHILRPGDRDRVLPVLLFERMQIAQQMYPAALVLAGVLVIAAVEVADQVPVELAAQNVMWYDFAL